MLITIPNYVKSKGGWIEYHIYVDSEFQGTGFWNSPGESEWVPSGTEILIQIDMAGKQFHREPFMWLYMLFWSTTRFSMKSH